MVVLPPEDRVRKRRVKSEQAIALAMRSRWDEAVQVNQEIIELFAKDVDAYNRLGKALMELGRYAESRQAYTRAAKLDPMNAIATKNLQRLAKLVEEGDGAPPPSSVDPRLFIEESGKTVVTRLTEMGHSDVLAKLTAGEQLELRTEGNQIQVVTAAGQVVGRIEPKLEQRLLSLLQKGGQYAVFVTATGEGAMNVIVRETHRTPAMGNRPSFRPAAIPEGGFRPYTREGVRYEAEEEDDEDAEEEEDEAEPGTPRKAAEPPTEASIHKLAAGEEADDEDEETP